MNRNSNAYLAAMGDRFYSVSVVPTVLDNDAYDSGDVISAGDVITNAVPEAGGYARLVSWFLIDFDDVGAALHMYLTQTSTVFGTKDSAPNISDANALLSNIQGHPLTTGTYIDIGGAKVFGADNVNRIVKAASGTRDLYLNIVSNASTPTYTTAAGLKLTLNFSKV